jgi:serine/threonine protein kinase
VAVKLFDPAAGRQRVERYELLGEIASGGMATVYLARLTGMGGFQRFVAMKRLHPHLATEKEFVEMFLDEARIAARIHHPNVVPILEVGASQLGYYLVMEYIEGDTLARLLARSASSGRRLPVSIALRVAIDMLSGLHAAHELHDDKNQPVNLVHRDVSPQNVLVGQDGIARITDFGVARAASRLNATRAGQLKGKIAYMAPEQAAGAEQLDRRADVFSAGVVIWESLAQKRLFKAENEAATLSRVIAEPVPQLSQIVPAVSAEVSAVVMRALERDPDKRFPTCAAFADALEAAAAATDKVAAPRDLAGYLSEVMGAEIAQQREAVRAWLAHGDPATELPSGPGQMSSVSAAAMSIPGLVEASRSSLTNSPPPLPRPDRSRGPIILGGLTLLLLLGVGGFLLARSAGSRASSEQAAPRETDAAAATVAPAPVQPSASAPPPAAADAPSAPASQVAPPATAPAASQLTPAAVPPGGGRALAPRPKKKKPSDDVDLRNPYR